MPTVSVSINNSSGYFQFSAGYPYNSEYRAFILQFLDLRISDSISGQPAVKDEEYSMLTQACVFLSFYSYQFVTYFLFLDLLLATCMISSLFFFFQVCFSIHHVNVSRVSVGGGHEEDVPTT